MNILKKSVLISIKPKWCELIASGKKTVEVRKTKPNIETPFKVYIYCTQDKSFNFCTDDGEQYTHIGNGKVIGEFVCNNIDWHGLNNLIVKEDAEHTLNGTCLTTEEVLDYLGYQRGTNIYACKNYDFYGWHISDLVIYDKPKALSEFKRVCDGDCQECKYAIWQTSGWTYEPKIVDCKPITKPPQSWCYVEGVKP